MKQPRRLTSNPTMKNAKAAGMIIFFAVMLVFLVLVGRLFFIAGHKNVSGHNLNEAARQTFMSEQTQPATRGEILTSNGTVLADNTTTYNMYAVLQKTLDAKGKPVYVVDKDKTATKLAPILGMKKSQFMAYFDVKKGTYQIEFGAKGRNLSVAQHKKIEALNLPGIYFTSQSARQYPNGREASHIIGATTTKTNKLGVQTQSGFMGIEASQNSLLAGKNGLKKVFSTPSYELSQATTGKQAQDGDDVYLTLDSKLQNTLEEKMDDLIDSMAPKNAVGVLMEAKTGRIVAATQRPNYNPNTLEGLKKLYANLLVQNAFEPGSVMKGITLSAAIDTGNWHPDETYPAGTYTVTGKTINDYEKDLGTISYRKAFAVSANTAFARVEQLMGSETWLKYMHNFGLEKLTKTGFDDEDPGHISFRYPIEQANTAFGQGISVTPVQLLQAYSAIANHGKMIRPYIVDKVVNPQTGAVKEQGKTETVGQPIKASTADAVLKEMVDVVNDSYGTAREFDLRDEGYQISAKTGTAQISEGGKYLDGLKNTVFSVMSVAPTDDPQYIFYMEVTQPTKFVAGETPQGTMAKLFKPVLLQALNNSSAAVKSTTAAVSVPDETGKSVTEATKALSKKGLRVALVGSKANKVTSQSIPANHQALTNQLVVLKTSGSGTLMPDMTGWSLRDVQTFADLAGVSVSYTGSGFVTGQNLSTSTILTSSQAIAVTLKQKE